MKTTHFTIINPYSQVKIADVPWSTQADLEKKIQLVQKTNSSKSIQDRANILKKLSQLLIENETTISNLLAQEIGRPVKDGLIEVQRAALTTNNSALEVCALKGELLYSDSCYPMGAKPVQKMGLVKRAPYGVVLAIIPFNFPINLAMHKIAPAFAMGNTILVKPHPQCYSSTVKLIELCYQAGMQENEIQLIYPDNSSMQALLAHPDIDLISFTGGMKTAQIISQNCGIKKTIFELGGNDALVVFPDADLKKVIDTIVLQRFRCSGQRCTAPKRIFLHNKISSELTQLLVEQTQKLVVGDPQKNITDVGPVINTEAAKFIEQKITESIKLGATSVGNIKIEKSVVHPIILNRVTAEMPVIADETFGPVACMMDFNNTEDVISKINQSRLGLQCGVFTQDINVLKKFFDEVRVGTVLNNEGPAYRLDHFPFGGFKDSGHGREGATEALMEFSMTKTLIL